MRILTVIAGILLSVEGAFCFIFYSYSFSSVAFPVGAVMTLAGALIVAAYIVSGRSRRLTDTVLVEGLVMAMFGFTILNDQVSDPMLTIFFGSFSIISGATRISQCFDVSRYKPHDWAKILPLSIVLSASGMIMMMPSIVAAANSLMIVGAAFIINGLSLLTYAMFMEKRTSAEREAEARARAAAKKAEREEKERQRDKMRTLSRAEQKKYKQQLREEKRKESEEKRKARIAEKEKERAARNVSRGTISFTKEETSQIISMTDDAYKAAQERAENDSAGREPSAVPYREIQGAKELAPLAKHQKITDAIPSVRNKQQFGNTAQSRKDVKKGADSSKKPRSAVKLDEIEEKSVELKFEDISLPDIQKQSKGGEAWTRNELLKELDTGVEKPEEFAGYSSITLNDLVSEEMPRPTLNEPGDLSFTQKLTFDWKSAINQDETKK